VFIGFAVLPSDDSRNDASRSNDSSGLRLVTATAGGAFNGLKLDEASAADVLEAAGKSAAAGVPAAGPNDWTYTRTESEGGLPVETSNERWVSPDGERTFAISSGTVTDPEFGPVGRSISIHFEYLRSETFGGVTWKIDENGPTDRQANWHADAGGGSAEVDRMVRIRTELMDARSDSDVTSLLDTIVNESNLEFRGGMACTPGSACQTWGYLPSSSKLSPAQSESLYKAGTLLSVLSSNLFPAASTRAAYDYLAALPETTTSPADDDTGDVILSFSVAGPQMETIRSKPQPKSNGIGFESRPVPGTTHNTKAVARIDSKTGRIVQLNPNPGVGDISYREVEAGLASGPGVGGELCTEFPDACAELRTLNDELKTDPKAQFHGVVDWMQIQQFCDGLVDRDGNVNKAAGPPLSAGSKADIARRDACIKRESESALDARAAAPAG
jgi:hypothetical protein